MKQELYLIVGASGTVGREVVKLLKDQGLQVRTTTSQAVKSKDGTQVHVNLATGEGIKEAFEGVDRAFFLSPPGYADQQALLSPLIQEAKRRALKKVVLMTAMGSNTQDTPFRRSEQELANSGLNYNIIRPNWFFQNFNTFWIQGILSQGKILLPAGKAKTSFIDARDIAAVGVKLLTKDDLSRQAFDLTGPEALDHDQVAEEISTASGKNIRYQEISVDDFRKGLLSAGLPNDYVNLLVAIMGFLREGYAAAVTDSVEKILGRKALSVKSYAQDYKKSWLSS